MSQSKSLGQFAALLKERQEPIVAAWISAVRADEFLSVAQNLRTSQLRDEVPKLIAELCAVIAAAGAPDEKHELETLAQNHGRLRLEFRFRLEEVLREIALLRRVLLIESAFLEDTHPDFRGEVLLQARLLMNEFLDEIAISSAHGFITRQLHLLDSAGLRLLRTISHELRNAVGSIDLMGTLLTEEDDPQERGNSIEGLKRNIQQMKTLLNDMLDVAPLLSGVERLRIKPVSLKEFLGGMAEDLVLLAKPKGLALVWSVDSSLGEVLSDELKLRRIVLNLATNAIKYTPSGKVHIECHDAGPSHWHLVVSDTGPGIPENLQGRIFQEFYRVQGTKHVEGTGLGLAICKQLVSILQGKIELHSEVGKGSCFRVLLPKEIDSPQDPSI